MGANRSVVFCRFRSQTVTSSNGIVAVFSSQRTIFVAQNEKCNVQKKKQVGRNKKNQQRNHRPQSLKRTQNSINIIRLILAKSNVQAISSAVIQPSREK